MALNIKPTAFFGPVEANGDVEPGETSPYCRLSATLTVNFGNGQIVRLNFDMIEVDVDGDAADYNFADVVIKAAELSSCAQAKDMSSVNIDGRNYICFAVPEPRLE